MKAWEEWRLNGLRLQLVSRFVFPRLGYSVLKGQEEPWTSIEKDRALLRRLQVLSPYLRDYADYIVATKREIFVVDVKAPASVRVKPWRGPFHRCSVTFSKCEWEEYTTSKIPVMLLVWDYGSTKKLDEQDQPVFYSLVNFKSLPFPRELTRQFEVRIDPRTLQPRKLSPPAFKRLVAKCRAMEVEEIEPGRIEYCAHPNAGRSR
jgi:hypothetical protein